MRTITYFTEDDCETLRARLAGEGWLIRLHELTSAPFGFCRSKMVLLEDRTFNAFDGPGGEYRAGVMADVPHRSEDDDSENVATLHYALERVLSNTVVVLVNKNTSAKVNLGDNGIVTVYEAIKGKFKKTPVKDESADGAAGSAATGVAGAAKEELPEKGD